MVRFRIKLTEHVAISTIMSKITNCSWCNSLIKQDSVAVCIYKSNTTQNPINAWVHISCLNELNDRVQSEAKLKGSEIMAKNL
jgi:hypothetical protein